MNSFLDISSKVSTPLGLAGLILAILCLTIRRVLSQNIIESFKAGRKEEGRKEWANLVGKVLLFVTVLSLVAIVLGFAGFIYGTSKQPEVLYNASLPYTVEEQSLMDLKNKVGVLQVKYESVTRYNALREEVNTVAPELARRFLEVDDGKVRPAYRILKYEYSCYAYLMAAATETGDKEGKIRRIDYAEKSIGACEKSKNQIEQSHFIMQYDKATSKERSENAHAYEWVRANHDLDRTLYLLAISWSILGQTENRADLQSKVIDILKQIDATYLRKIQPEKTQELSWSLGKLKGVSK